MNEESNDILRELARVAADLGPALAPAGHQELVRSITSAAESIFGAAACSIALLDETTDELVFYVASGTGAEDVVGMRIPSNQGIAGWVVTSGQPIAIEDVRRDARFAADVAESTGYTPTSILAMPLETERRMIGVIEVLDRDTVQRDGRNDLELLGLFAAQAALAIENSRIFTDLGRALFGAAGIAADGSDLDSALRKIADEAPSPNDNLAEIARLFHQLGQSGPEERALAVRLLNELLAYARTRSWPT
jgi:GAF domain-containing protein